MGCDNLLPSTADLPLVAQEQGLLPDQADGKKIGCGCIRRASQFRLPEFVTRHLRVAAKSHQYLVQVRLQCRLVEAKRGHCPRDGIICCLRSIHDMGREAT